MLMAKIKVMKWNGRSVLNTTNKEGKSVIIFTNKYAAVPQNIINLGTDAFKGWLKKQVGIQLVKVRENLLVSNYSLVSNEYANKYNKL